MTRSRGRAQTADSSFINLDATYDATDNLTFDGQAGWTLGSGPHDIRAGVRMARWQRGSYTFNGYTNLATVGFPGLATNSPGVNGVNNVGTSWAWDDIDDSVDKETYAKLDGTFKRTMARSRTSSSACASRITRVTASSLRTMAARPTAGPTCRPTAAASTRATSSRGSAAALGAATSSGTRRARSTHMMRRR